MKRIVKLVAVDQRYKQSNYPYRCIYHDGLATYLTGQHIDPNDPSTSENLTADEMTGKVKLTAQKTKNYPFVINPLNVINLYNNQQFDLTKNPDGSYVNYKDYALVTLLRNHGWFVAPSRDKVVPKKHYYYLHDEIFEAEKRVTTSDLQYRAEKYIREENTEDGLKDVALILSYKLKNFTYDPKEVSSLILKDQLLKICKESPEKILECKLPDAADELFVLKLAYNGIITRRGTDFYDGSKFIGNDLLEVRKFMKLDENVMLVSKWNRMLAEKENRIPVKDKDNELTQKKEALFESISGKSLDELKAYAGSRRYAKVEWAELKTEEELLKYLIGKVK